jgi:predicted dehydrogenase
MAQSSGPVGVVVVGYGYWGANLARNVVAAGSTRLVAVADPDEDRRRAAEAATGARTLRSLDEALAIDEVDAVIIATPASTHAAAAITALGAGRHVLVEKPLAMTPDDADAVVEAAAAAERTLMVGHTFLYSRPVEALRQLIHEGELGKVQYLYSQRLSLGRIRRDCNALWNFAPHDVSIMLHLLDEPVVEVSAKGFSFIGPGIDDVCFASLTFASGVGANLHVSWIDPRKTRLLTVVGDRKMAIYDDVSVDRKLSIVDAGVAGGTQGFGDYESLGDFQWRTRAGDIVIPHLAMVEPLRAELEAFGTACATGVAPPTDGVHGAQVVRVLHAIDASAARGGAPTPVLP